MTQIKQEIIPGKSLGGILLDNNINSVYEKFSPNHQIDKYNGVITIDQDLIIIGYDENEIIYSIMCGTKYTQKYQDKLWAGMTVDDVLRNTKKQVAYGGCVVVDGIDGIGLPLPDGLDDFDSITDFLKPDHIFKNLSIFKI